MNKNGTFPARYCMKISGRILSIEGNQNHSLLNSYIYYRSCLIDNIMDSSKALETSGNFRLKGYLDLETSFRVQGSLSLCIFDGCNHAHHSIKHCLTFTLFCLLILCLHQHRVKNRWCCSLIFFFFLDMSLRFVSVIISTRIGDSSRDKDVWIKQKTTTFVLWIKVKIKNQRWFSSESMSTDLW